MKMTLFKTNIILSGVLLTLAIAAPVPAQTTTNDDTVLKQIIIFGRHGVRAPTISQADYAQYSPRPYPDFGVLQPGYLTVHGQQAEVLLGAYYRSYLLFEGLLTGDSSADLARSYFRANSIQRSNLTATKLGAGLLNGTTVPVHSYPLGTADPVFDPILANVAAVDPVRAANEAQEIYNSGAALASAYSGEFSLIRSVLFNYQNGLQPPPPTPPGITDPTTQPVPLTAVTTLLYTGNVVDEGGLAATNTAADPFVMEYANGFPLADVGWGQLSLDTLSQATRITNLTLGIAMRTPYVDQVQSSNAAEHILRSMRQVVLNESIPGAFGDATSKVIAVISSDAYVAGLAGLLNLHWQLPGYQPDFCAMGGALVFEVRQSTRSGEYLVRAFYTAQSFDQLRNLTPLSLGAPPETIQLSIPGGSQPGTTLDVKFEIFQKLVMNTIGRQYVQNPSLEVPPGVLASVPGQ
jgi:4-phytase/acid phosphatase